jgi:ribonuclease D
MNRSRSGGTAGDFELVTSQSDFDRLISRLESHPFIAFDTEFVSEHTYRSQLCLIQIAAPGVMAAVDTFAVRELDAFWNLLTSPERTTVVHAGREELGFALHSTGRLPARLFDVQIAAGLVDHDFPAGYGALVRRLLGRTANKGETRTDWRQRPLSDAQLAYAMDDVRHLEDLWTELQGRLAKHGREAWMQAEMASWQEDVVESFQRKRWRRVSGLTGLTRRELAIARELWHWRDSVAEARDMPPKRVLRDDLLVELAKRKSADIREIQAIRGMQRSDFKHIIKGIADAIDRGLALPEAELPGGEKHRAPPPQLAMLGQFLATAVAGLCRQMSLAPAMVGTVSDMRDLLALKLGYDVGDREPLLATGWRAEVVGEVIDDLLAGRATLRIADPRSHDPLVIDRPTRD